MSVEALAVYRARRQPDQGIRSCAVSFISWSTPSSRASSQQVRTQRVREATGEPPAANLSASRPIRRGEGSGGPGVRRPHHRRQGPVRRAHLGRGQAGRGGGVDGLRSGRMAAALVGERRRRAHRPPDGRWFGAAPELYADRRGAGRRRADRAHRQGGARLSLRRRVPGLAGPELQHVHRLDRAGGAGAGRSTFRPRRSARTTSAAPSSARRRAAAASSSRSAACSAWR